MSTATAAQASTRPGSEPGTTPSTRRVEGRLDAWRKRAEAGARSVERTAGQLGDELVHRLGSALAVALAKTDDALERTHAWVARRLEDLRSTRSGPGGPGAAVA
jgi:hypothetical protein